MADTLFASEFRQACSTKGCPFCSIAQLRTKRYISGLLYEYVTAPDIHKRLADSGGLCNRHAWLLQYIAHSEEKDGMGVAIFYGSVVARVIGELDAVGGHGAPGARTGRGKNALAAIVAEGMRPRRTCLACEHQVEGERFTVRQFLDELEDAGAGSVLVKAYVQSAGACLPHFEALMEGRPSDRAVEWLVANQQERFIELAAQLETYVRKHEVQHKHEPMGVERDSWVRVIELCIGKRDVPLSAPGCWPSGGLVRE